MLTKDESRKQFKDLQVILDPKNDPEFTIPINPKALVEPADNLLNELKNALVILELITDGEGMQNLSPRQREVITSGGKASFRPLKISKCTNHFYGLDFRVVLSDASAVNHIGTKIFNSRNGRLNPLGFRLGIHVRDKIIENQHLDKLSNLVKESRNQK